jgi:hypothetical protein
VEILHAATLLFWALLRTLFAPLVGGRRGLPDFKASYAPDRLPPVAPDERRTLSRLGGCIACGLCDAADPGVMDLMLASSRSMPDFDVAVESFAAHSDERLARLEARCPTRVPMRKVAALVRAKAAEVTGLHEVESPRER